MNKNPSKSFYDVQAWNKVIKTRNVKLKSYAFRDIISASSGTSSVTWVIERSAVCVFTNEHTDEVLFGLTAFFVILMSQKAFFISNIESRWMKVKSYGFWEKYWVIYWNGTSLIASKIYQVRPIRIYIFTKFSKANGRKAFFISKPNKILSNQEIVK